VRKIGVEQERVVILHPGCDVIRFFPKQVSQESRQKILGERAKDRVILTVGGLVSRKGHDMVIRALPILREEVPDLTYLIVGDGPYREKLEELAKSLGVRDHVVFLGKVSEQDMPEMYALCDIFAMPSREQLDKCDVEGFGIVYLEANACGKPVIGGRTGGIPDAVIDGYTGFLVDPNDPRDIARTIQSLLTDKELAGKLADQGRSRVVNELSLTRMRDHLLTVFRSIGFP
jgi:phosphatidylinositol alpha-1,6-mannosyltransferase